MADWHVRRGRVHLGHWLAAEQDAAVAEEIFRELFNAVGDPVHQTTPINLALKDEHEDAATPPLVILEEKQYSERGGEASRRKTAGLPRDIMFPNLEATIKRLSALLPNAAARPPFEAQVLALFEKAAGITAPATEDTRLARLQARYEKRLREIVLPDEGGFTTKAEADAAQRLSGTLRLLQKVQRELGLPITDKPDRVRKAERLRKNYANHHTQTGEFVPPRRPGRPRRDAAEQAGIPAQP